MPNLADLEICEAVASKQAEKMTVTEVEPNCWKAASYLASVYFDQRQLSKSLR